MPLGPIKVGSEPVHLSFRDTADWNNLEGIFRVASVPIGDEEVGPLVSFWEAPPDVTVPPYPAHMHGSDSFRLALKGEAPVGKEIYSQGKFRLQEGWKPYGADNFALGPEGGWFALSFTDRRGVRPHPVNKNVEQMGSYEDEHLAWVLGIEKGDLLSGDRYVEAGPSGLVTHLEKASPKMSYVNGSFSRLDSWRSTETGNRVAVALMGDADVGPVWVFVASNPGCVSSPRCAFDTEVLRFVVRGSGRIGDDEYIEGDIRVQPKGLEADEVVAGRDGLQEVVVLGDRRGAIPPARTEGGWSTGLTETIKQLHARLLENQPA
jgi:hypothetical protein